MITPWSGDQRLGSAKLWIVLVVGLLLACGGGVAAARYLVMTEAAEDPGASGKNEKVSEKKAKSEEDYKYVPFGSVVVNLAEGRLTRYLKVKISLKLLKEDAPKMKKLTESGRKAVYTNWLITYLSGLKLEQVKGSDAIRRLRGKIRAGFNEILRRKQDIQIEAVLFEEFNVQ